MLCSSDRRCTFAHCMFVSRVGGAWFVSPESRRRSVLHDMKAETPAMSGPHEPWSTVESGQRRGWDGVGSLTHYAATAFRLDLILVTALTGDYFGAESQHTRNQQWWRDAEQKFPQHNIHAAGPSSTTTAPPPPPRRRSRPFAWTAARKIVSLIVWSAVNLPAARPADGPAQQTATE